MRVVTVYRLDYGGNSRYGTRQAIGSVMEFRKIERRNDHLDLLRLARRLFALDAEDARHIVIEVSPVRGAYFAEQISDRYVE